MADADDLKMPSADRPSASWETVVAVVWLCGFLVFFYCLTPPNNPNFSRGAFWKIVPTELLLLLDTIDPPAAAGTPQTSWSYFPQRFDLLATAVLILTAAWGLGSLAVRGLRISLKPNSAEWNLFAFALGLAALSLTTLLCGLAGWLNRGLFATVMAVGTAIELAIRLRERTRTSSRYNPENSETSLSSRCSSIAWRMIPLVPFLLAMLLAAMLPSRDFDVREYHLQGPKEYFQAGQISFLPHNVYTSFPFFTEMLSLLAMVLRGDWYRGALVGKTVLMCFGPLTGFALYVAGRRWFSPAAGYIAALVYLTMPWAFRISTIAYAEGGLTFYLFVSLFAFGMVIEKLRPQTPAAGRLVLLCGLLSGCAMACKYTGVVSVVIPLFAACCVAPFVLHLPTEQRKQAALRAGATFLLGTAITIGPWLLKNLVETGNPVYPLVYSVFGGRDWDAQLNAKWKAGHSPPNYSDLPERLLEVTAGNDWLTPLLFGLAPLSLFCWKRDWRIRLLWLYVFWLFATWWVLTHRIDRFWVPMTPVVALLAGLGAASISGRTWKIASRVCITAAVLFNLAFVVAGNAGNNMFLADLQRARQPPPGIDYLNRTLPRDARVLMVGEAQVFDAEFPLVYNTVFDYSIFEQWSAADQPGVSAQELPLADSTSIRRRLHEAGITHLFVNWQEILRYRTTYGYTKFVVPERFTELVQRGILKPPTTLAKVVDNELVEQLARRNERFQPLQQTLPDGEEIVVYSAQKSHTGDAAKELKAWGATLLRNADGRQLFVTGQLYEVAD